MESTWLIGNNNNEGILLSHTDEPIISQPVHSVNFYNWSACLWVSQTPKNTHCYQKAYSMILTAVTITLLKFITGKFLKLLTIFKKKKK